MAQINADEKTAARLAELHEMLRSERRKSLKKRDYERIEQLCGEIYNLTASDIEKETIADKASAASAAIQQRKNREQIRMRRFAVSVAACFALFIGCNALSVRAYGTGLVQTVYEKIAGGVQFQPDAKPKSQYDAMREACSSSGFSPLLPAYLPDSFTLTRTVTDTSPYVDF